MTKNEIFLELLTHKICMNLPVGYVLYALYVDLLCEVLEKHLQRGQWQIQTNMGDMSGKFHLKI